MIFFKKKVRRVVVRDAAELVVRSAEHCVELLLGGWRQRAQLPQVAVAYAADSYKTSLKPPMYDRHVCRGAQPPRPLLPLPSPFVPSSSCEAHHGRTQSMAYSAGFRNKPALLGETTF